MALVRSRNACHRMNLSLSKARSESGQAACLACTLRVTSSPAVTFSPSSALQVRWLYRVTWWFGTGVPSHVVACMDGGVWPSGCDVRSWRKLLSRFVASLSQSVDTKDLPGACGDATNTEVEESRMYQSDYHLRARVFACHVGVSPLSPLTWGNLECLIPA